MCSKASYLEALLPVVLMQRHTGAFAIILN